MIFLPQSPLMEEADAVLNLFDAFWFFHPQISQNQSINPDPQLIQQNSPQSNTSSQLSIHSRSKSDEILYVSSSNSPDSVLKSHLQTILSDREISAVIPKPPQLSKNTKRKRFSKSLSELEFEEVKGFTEIGFVFSEDDNDSRLAEIIPGLHRSKEIERVRPYLSEAWENAGMYRKKEAPPLIDWSVVAAMSNEIEMKDSLKCWAHTVASAVR